MRSEVAKLLSGSTLANLRYLDIAVLIECWHQWDLSTLLDELAGDHATSLSLSEVILPLVLQRCCAPRSKLEATRWVPTTAIPEVLGLDIDAFHNSRIHRSLSTLFDVTDRFQQELCKRYLKNDGVSQVLFMDVTDTYFEGIGCSMAQQTRTKSEMPNKRCLGIILLANEYGYPLRWKVVGGKTKDWKAMGGLLEDIGQVEWLEQSPVVFDRAFLEAEVDGILAGLDDSKKLSATKRQDIFDEIIQRDLPCAIGIIYHIKIIRSINYFSLLIRNCYKPFMPLLVRRTLTRKVLLQSPERKRWDILFEVLQRAGDPRTGRLEDLRAIEHALRTAKSGGAPVGK